MLFLPAASISRSIQRGLSIETLPLTVVARFDNACDFVAADGRVFALVNPKVGNGPLNIVVDARLADLPLPPAGAAAGIDEERLRLGEIEIGLACADWNPRPDWNGLRTRYPAVFARAPALVRLARELAASPGLLALLNPDLPAERGTLRVVDVFREALLALPPGEIWPPDRVERLAARVAGLGAGLTPAGDDWLAGLLTWAWLAHPQAEDVGAAVVRAAAPRTTILSAAFLSSAAQGECDAAWQNFLDALASDRASGLEAATRAVLAHGATSGADKLAGFLYPMGKVTN